MRCFDTIETYIILDVCAEDPAQTSYDIVKRQ